MAGEQKFWADGIEDLSVLEAKMVVTPSNSPYIPGTNIPDPIRENMLDEVRNEFERISKILRDEGNPLESLKVITNNEDAKPFFEALMRQYRIPGQVVVK